MDLGIKGRRALIAGSSNGIGSHIAAALAAEGVEVILHGRDGKRAEALARTLRAEGAAVSVLLASLDDPADVARLASAAVESGPVDILINSAGAALKVQPWFDVQVEDWRRQYELSVLYAVGLIRALAPSMRERGWGRILNLSSSAAIKAMPMHPEYAAAKLALHSVTNSLVPEFADSGVTVNTLVCGAVLTDVTKQVIVQQGAALGFEERGAALQRRVMRDVWQVPLGRAGELDEIAAAAAFLVSEPAGYITGAALRADGGATGTLA